jgi:hypothetical protein
METLQDTKEKVTQANQTQEELAKVFCKKCMLPANPDCEICNGVP